QLHHYQQQQPCLHRQDSSDLEAASRRRLAGLAAAAGGVMEMLQGLNDDGTTLVMVTHSAAHADYARRTINLFDGSVVTQSLRAA
ncbi:MAG: ABC transporter ATP-binding protein, partial [Pseudomonadota bacterium]